MYIPLNINDCILVKKILQEFAGTNTVNLFYPNKNTTIVMSLLILKKQKYTSILLLPLFFKLLKNQENKH